eukprot:TRINITY_DN31993_c0_g1_i1.p2 TRINITY_DN31993_c0_g1~~TRINITY_DN31993_c0_g1_i1.p2  ORF type:complete len:248 (-),score=24.15 TRINITY_DN31993_c0_g1_i1:535-1278(-)
MVQMSGMQNGQLGMLESVGKELNMTYDQLHTELQDWLKNKEKYQVWKQKEEMEERRVQMLQQQIDRSVEIVRAQRENSQSKKRPATRSNGNVPTVSQTSSAPYPIQQFQQGNRQVQDRGLQQLSVTSVQQLQREFEYESAMFNDDIQFLNEVATGREVVEDMNPVHELVNLKKQFETWTEKFKIKLRKAKDIVHNNFPSIHGSPIDVQSGKTARSATPLSLRSTSRDGRPPKFVGLFRTTRSQQGGN